MATRTWNSSSSTDMNDGNNYSPTGAIAATDDLLFDGTSVVNASTSAALSVKSITSVAAYTGRLLFQHAWTTTGAVNLNHNGLLTNTSTYTSGGDMTLTAGTNLGNLNLVSGTLIFNHNCTLHVPKTGFNWGTIKGGADGKTLTKTGGTTMTATTLEMLHANGTIDLTDFFVLNGTTPIANALGTLKTSSTIILIGPTGGGTVTVKGRVIEGSLTIRNDTGACTFNQDGDIIAVTVLIRTLHASNVIYNLNGYDIAAFLGTFTYQNSVASSTLTINHGTGGNLLIVGNMVITATYSLTINMGTSSVIALTGSLTTTGANLTFNRDTASALYCFGTSNQNITMGGMIIGLFKVDGASIVSVLDASRAATYDFAPGAQIKFKAGVNHTLDSHTSGDIDGTAGNLATITSDSAGSQFNFINPASMSVSYVSVKDDNATNLVLANDGTSVNAGNTTNWRFFTGSRFAEELEEEY